MIPANLQEYRYVSRYGTDTLGLQIHVAGTLTDADGAVTVRMSDADNTTIFTRSATNVGTGKYTVTLASSESSTPGYYAVLWSYDLNSDPQEYETFIEVGPSAPAYDALNIEGRDIVESVWSRFADLFDSPMGGPHLQVYFQSKFGRGRVAQAMNWALGRINTQSQPKQQWAADNFPYSTWGALLEQGTYVETIKHLRRSYIEQPEASAIGTARMDRRDYMARWSEVQQEEEQIFKQMLDNFKIRAMGLGGGRVLVSGGAYGNLGPVAYTNPAVARPIFWARFY